MSCHDIGRGIDSVTQVVIKMYDAGEITGLFHPDETSRWSRFVYCCLDKFASAGSVTELSRMNQKNEKKQTFSRKRDKFLQFKANNIYVKNFFQELK